MLERLLWRRGIDERLTLEALIAGAQAGVSLALGAALMTSRLAPAVRLCGVLAAAAYSLNCLLNSPAGDLIEPVRWLWVAIAALSASAGGLLWVMVLAVFDDKPIKPALFIPAAALALAALVLVTTQGSIRAIAWWVANILVVMISLHALYILARGREADLVESRRKLRRPVVLACITMGASQLALLLFGQDRAPEYTAPALAFAELLAFAFLTGALLELRRAVFDPPPARQPREDTDADLIAALTEVMDRQEAWREEGLGIGALAQRLGVPEHRLRRLINGRLGHSNFPSFINGYRIEAAKRRLADPAEKHRPIAQIAFDLGFTSLSPFNRAFKEATGQTPTEWRRNALGPAKKPDGN